jgi:nitrogen regulatory protein PII
MEKLDQRIQLVASSNFSKTIDQWRRTQSDLPSRSEAIRRLVHLGLTFDEENPMRMITAIIRPHKYEELREALIGLGIEGITVTQVKGFGRQKGKTEVYRGAEYEAVEVPKLRLEIAVQSTMIDQVLSEIEKIAKTGKIGDGKLFVHALSDVVRIRTGERDEQALG